MAQMNVDLKPRATTLKLIPITSMVSTFYVVKLLSTSCQPSGLVGYLVTLFGHGWLIIIIIGFLLLAIVGVFLSKSEDDDDFSLSYQFGQSSPVYLPPQPYSYPQQPTYAQDYHVRDQETENGLQSACWSWLSYFLCCFRNNSSLKKRSKRRGDFREEYSNSSRIHLAHLDHPNAGPDLIPQGAYSPQSGSYNHFGFGPYLDSGKSQRVHSAGGGGRRGYNYNLAPSSTDSSVSSLPGLFPARNQLARSASDNYCVQMRGYTDRPRKYKKECHRCSSPIQQLEMLSLSKQSPYVKNRDVITTPKFSNDYPRRKNIEAFSKMFPPSSPGPPPPPRPPREEMVPQSSNTSMTDAVLEEQIDRIVDSIRPLILSQYQEVMKEDQEAKLKAEQQRQQLRPSNPSPPVVVEEYNTDTMITYDNIQPHVWQDDGHDKSFEDDTDISEFVLGQHEPPRSEMRVASRHQHYPDQSFMGSETETELQDLSHTTREETDTSFAGRRSCKSRFANRELFMTRPISETSESQTSGSSSYLSSNHESGDEIVQWNSRQQAALIGPDSPDLRPVTRRGAHSP